jgi:hypothetical protein
VVRPTGGHAFIEVVTRLLSSHAGRSGAPGERQIAEKPQPGLDTEETSQPAERADRRVDDDPTRG